MNTIDALYLGAERKWHNQLIETSHRVNHIIAGTRCIIGIPQREYGVYLQVLQKAVDMTHQNKWIVDNLAVVTEYFAAVDALTDAISTQLDQALSDLHAITAASNDPEALREALRHVSPEVFRFLMRSIYN